VEYITGWAVVLGLLAAGALYAMNTIYPQQGERRIWFHCTIGKLTLVATVAHLLSMPFEGFNSFAIWSAMGLIFLTLGTGLILSYIPDAGGIRYHARSIHSALIIAIIIAVAHHVLVVLEII
jgi:predicted exporter